MGFLSKAALLRAYNAMSELTNDPSAQGATQVTSALRYLFALDEFTKEYGRCCDTSNKEDRDAFISFVGNVVSLNNDLYTANFFNAIKDNSDYAVGSNFFSVNVVKNSTVNPNTDFPFPKRGNTPLFIVKGGCLIENPELLVNLREYLHTPILRNAFAVWLMRFEALDQNDVFNSIVVGLKNRYSDRIISELLLDKQILMRFVGDSLNDNPYSLSISDFSPSNTKKKKMKVPHLDEPLQIIYYGAPGTGKSHKIDNDPHVTDENTIRTTFHPDSDYSTFVGAYKPTMAPMPVNAFVGTTVHHAKNADNEKVYEKKIVYKYVPQAFLKAYVAAWSDLDNPHFLVIEEINRGNCAQIFGDLFQLLDRNNTGSSSYAIHADEDINRFLAEDKNGFAILSEEQIDAIRSFVLVKDSGKTEAIGDAILAGKKLLLPPNLYIWATMNTSDQSLFPIDSAFKRRWNWEYMPIDYDALDWQFEAGGKRYLWSDFLKKINPLIYNLTQSSDKQMGYFFAKADKKTDDSLTENNLISEKIFLNKVLFYLWTDVLKDFEAGDKIFRDEEKGQMYQFSDFFPTTNGKLAEFVGKLELPVIGDSVSDNSSVDDEDDTSGNNTKSSKDQSRYSVNGVGTLKKGPAAVEAMRLYVQNNPDATAADIVSAWKIPGFPLVESEESFASRLAKSNDDRLEKRTELINLANGESIRIFKGFNPQSMQDFINALDKQDWNIIIRKV